MELIKFNKESDFKRAQKTLARAGANVDLALSVQTAAIANPEWIGKPPLLAKRRENAPIAPQEKVRILPTVDPREIIGKYNTITVTGRFVDQDGMAIVRKRIEAALKVMGAHDVVSAVPTRPRNALLVVGAGQKTNKIRAAEANPDKVDIMTQEEFWNHFNNFVEIIDAQIVEPSTRDELWEITEGKDIKIHVDNAPLGSYEKLAKNLLKGLKASQVLIHNSGYVGGRDRALAWERDKSHTPTSRLPDIKILLNRPTREKLLSGYVDLEFKVNAECSLILMETVDQIVGR